MSVPHIDRLAYAVPVLGIAWHTLCQYRTPPSIRDAMLIRLLARVVHDPPHSACSPHSVPQSRTSHSTRQPHTYIIVAGSPVPVPDSA
eukprot:2160838-Rhodomonas_salina.4